MSENDFMLYPIYIDSTRTRKEGRKYSKIHSIENPKYSEIKMVLDKLNYKYKAEDDKKHPVAQHIPGRFLITRNELKRKNIVVSVVDFLKKIRQGKKEESSKLKVNNSLKLVPKKKKKTKKNK